MQTNRDYLRLRNVNELAEAWNVSTPHNSGLGDRRQSKRSVDGS
jgi:hypothetical protein